MKVVYVKTDTLTGRLSLKEPRMDSITPILLIEESEYGTLQTRDISDYIAKHKAETQEHIGIIVIGTEGLKPPRPTVEPLTRNLVQLCEDFNKLRYKVKTQHKLKVDKPYNPSQPWKKKHKR